MPFPVLKLYWHFIGRSAGTNKGIKKYSVLQARQHISNTQMLNIKSNNLKAKQTGSFPNIPSDHLTDKIINDHYEKWQLGPRHSQPWQSVTDCKETIAIF